MVSLRAGTIVLVFASVAVAGALAVKAQTAGGSQRGSGAGAAPAGGGTARPACRTQADCQDSDPCNGQEYCAGGIPQPGRTPADDAPYKDCWRTRTQPGERPASCEECVRDEQCGPSVCTRHWCEHTGPRWHCRQDPPLACPAGRVCDDHLGRTCVAAATVRACAAAGWDADGDGYLAVGCGGQDCDDHDRFTRPHAREVCELGAEGTFAPTGDWSPRDRQRKDEDCDPLTVAWPRTYDNHVAGVPHLHGDPVQVGGAVGVYDSQPLHLDGDLDGDGLISNACCNPDRRPGKSGMLCGRDCDDSNPAIVAGSVVCDLVTGDAKVCMDGAWKVSPCARGTVCIAQPNGTGVCQAPPPGYTPPRRPPPVPVPAPAPSR